MTATVSSEGVITITISKLSLYSVVIGDITGDASSTAATDSSSTSPKTGVDLTAVAGGTAAAIAGAGVVAYALRRKVVE